jgi:hypothetical protein
MPLSTGWALASEASQVRARFADVIGEALHLLVGKIFE